MNTRRGLFSSLMLAGLGSAAVVQEQQGSPQNLPHVRGYEVVPDTEANGWKPSKEEMEELLKFKHDQESRYRNGSCPQCGTKVSTDSIGWWDDKRVVACEVCHTLFEVKAHRLVQA